MAVAAGFQCWHLFFFSVDFLILSFSRNAQHNIKTAHMRISAPQTMRLLVLVVSICSFFWGFIYDCALFLRFLIRAAAALPDWPELFLHHWFLFDQQPTE